MSAEERRIEHVKSESLLYAQAVSGDLAQFSDGVEHCILPLIVCTISDNIAASEISSVESAHEVRALQTDYYCSERMVQSEECRFEYYTASTRY